MADEKTADGSVVILGGRVEKQVVAEKIMAPAITVDDAITDRGLALSFRADMDLADLQDGGKGIVLLIELADDLPGQPDEKLEWREDSRCVWQGGNVRADRANPNPALSTYGGLKGKRARCTVHVIGGPVMCGGDYEVREKPAGLVEAKP